MDFRLFFKIFHEGKERRPLTTADSMRSLVRAYRHYRRCQGLNDEVEDPVWRRELAEKMEYHIGACELAELIGNEALAEQHREAFFAVWKEWYDAVSGRRSRRPTGDKPLSPKNTATKTLMRWWKAVRAYLTAPRP